MRAKIVLASAYGESNSSIAVPLDLINATVGKWRTRFIAQRIQGLHGELLPGMPPTIGDERVADLINRTLQTRPESGATDWSVRSIAADTGISPTNLRCYFGLFGLQPHRSESFKLSTDPLFIE
jgi:putative transposase